MMIRFAKYHALGNSFIVIDEIQTRGRLKKYEKLAAHICDQSVGVGADGIMVVSRREDKIRLDIYNADGSWAEKSGNGVRIAAMHLYNRGIITGKNIELLTGSGVSKVTFHSGSENRRIISASMGTPEFETASIPVKVRDRYFINQPVPCAGRSLVATAVSVGNPHLILFCDDFDFDWEEIGSLLEMADLFPNRINVGFVIVKSETDIEVRDWERGVGPTGSSGTGAAAAVAVAVVRGFTARRVNVHTLSGMFHVKWDVKSDQLIIRGPVEFVCAGNYFHSR
jgi:diaminopimelate epimerase